ncbi:low molecular weight phosphatase family protein [Mycolicibacterium sp. 120266]|uniref:arsenate reductase/protein-tyrosine-phosphatase family protein n=1 Tax=Mycolicibacterium sp. 120266 TaxID=3090601 RepID=UPI00299EDE88|nr:low molecular weight phosphatase family protein [Mycolicibacterium sp. 120266]MDX1872130.1 low molecular weight phosphatase family protein [Mycolicibacterium sp. 120266]
MKQGVRLHVLFVCTGNICRSPTAERLSALMGAERDIPDFRTSSAGTRAVIGHEMHKQAAEALRALGGDPSGFMARHLTSRIAGAADLVLTMTTAHRSAVLELAPRQLRKTFTLSEASLLAAEYEPRSLADLADLRPRLAGRQADDIPDPIGQDDSYFAAVAALIAHALPPIIELCRRSVALPDS